MSRFRAPAWAWLLTAAAVAGFGSLSAWQVSRARDKEMLLASLADAARPRETLSAGAPPPRPLEMRRVSATGTYLADRQLLQDGQSLEHRPGYHVWTPLRLAEGDVVMVDRGWVPLDRAGLDAPVPAARTTVRGFWRTLPEPGLRLGDAPTCAPSPAWPAVVVYPTAAELACLVGQPVLPGLLLLDAAEPAGHVREWSDLGFPPERHYGYAVQWLGLAVAAAVIFFLVNRKPSP